MDINGWPHGFIRRCHSFHSEARERHPHSILQASFAYSSAPISSAFPPGTASLLDEGVPAQLQPVPPAPASAVDGGGSPGESGLHTTGKLQFVTE